MTTRITDEALDKWRLDAQIAGRGTSAAIATELIAARCKIAALDAIVEKHDIASKFKNATPGEWESISSDPKAPGWVQTASEDDICDTYSGLNGGVAQTVPSSPKHIANAEFIAAAHNAIGDILKLKERSE